LRRALVLVLVLALASACTAAASSDDPVVLRVAMADDWASAPVVTDVIDEFEEDHPNVRVEVQPSPFSQIPDLVRSGLELDQSYDLAHWHAFAAAAAGLARPVDEHWERHGLRADEYLDGAVQSVTWLGRRYGVPLDTNALVLMVRPEVLAEAGVTSDDLADVDDVLDVAQRLVDEEAAPHAMLIGASSWTAYGWIRAFGGRLVTIDDATGEPTFTFTDERTVAALDVRARLVEEGLAPSPFAPDISAEGVQLFAQGQVAVHSGGSWDLPLLAREDVGPEEVEVLPLPQGDGDTGTVLGGSSLFVPVEAEHPDLAFELALRLTEDRIALRLAREEGRLPARTQLFDDEFFTSSPDIEAFVQQLPDADVMPLIAFPEVSEAFREAIENTLAGRQDAQQAMEEVQRFAESWLERQ
jgi:multiple sugar transport system substrate-binding protein